MKHFSNKDNTADITIRIFAGNPSELLQNTVYAIASLIHRIVGLRSEARTEYSAKYNSLESASVDIANFVISEFEISNTLYYLVRDVKFEQGYVLGQLRGHHFPTPTKVRNVLKAATYHNLHFNVRDGYMDLTVDV